MTSAIEKRPRTSFGQSRLSWLESRHHFSFGTYFNPDRHRFGALRVVNDDLIAAGAGFDMHTHKDMEIITYVTKGAVHHRDSLGNHGVTGAGSVQVMSAGSGIAHAEFADPATDTHLFQIWLTPSSNSIAPRWDHVDMPKDNTGENWTLLASGFDDDLTRPGVLQIHQAARLLTQHIAPGDTQTLDVTRSGYAIVTSGSVTAQDHDFGMGDAMAIARPCTASLQAGPDGACILYLDLPLV
ncbi:MAG: pirin family protein [Pseudomonadota bacterium]